MSKDYGLHLKLSSGFVIVYILNGFLNLLVCLQIELCFKFVNFTELFELIKYAE